MHILKRIILRFKRFLESETSNAIFRSLMQYFLTYFIVRLNAVTYGFYGSQLGAGSRIKGTKFITFKKSVSIGRLSWIEAVSEFNNQKFDPEIIIGDNFSSSDRLHISAVNSIVIGNNCLLGSGIYISDHNHGSYKNNNHSHPSVAPIKRPLISHGTVILEDNVWIGDNVVILGPVVIGAGAVVGANSLVNQDIPASSIAAGLPAKVVKIFNHKSGTWDPVL